MSRRERKQLEWLENLERFEADAARVEPFAEAWSEYDHVPCNAICRDNHAVAAANAFDRAVLCLGLALVMSSAAC